MGVTEMLIEEAIGGDRGRNGQRGDRGDVPPLVITGTTMSPCPGVITEKDQLGVIGERKGPRVPDPIRPSELRSLMGPAVGESTKDTSRGYAVSMAGDNIVWTTCGFI